jgi:hypothetical protein
MFLFILCAGGLSFAQDIAPASPGVDADITVTGRDDAVLPVPAPWQEASITVPPLEPQEVPPLLIPPVRPPLVDWSGALPGALPSKTRS